jgi:hypothetical protein
MQPKSILATAAVTLIAASSYVASVLGQTGKNSVPVYVSTIPAGYRDWRVISVANEEANLHSFSVVLGNDAAIEAYREGKLPFPDGAVVLALHYRHVPSEENNKVFGDAQSFVPGAPTNIQLEIKDAKKYSATGGWGFGFFDTAGKPVPRSQMSSCAPCHAKSSTDFVFTHYAP